MKKKLIVLFSLFVTWNLWAYPHNSRYCELPNEIKSRQEAAKYYDDEAVKLKGFAAMQLYSRSVECDPLFRSGPWIALARHTRHSYWWRR